MISQLALMLMVTFFPPQPTALHIDNPQLAIVEQYDLVPKNKDKEKAVSDAPDKEKGSFFDRFKKPKEQEDKESSLLKTSQTHP